MCWGECLLSQQYLMGQTTSFMCFLLDSTLWVAALLIQWICFWKMTPPEWIWAPFWLQVKVVRGVTTTLNYELNYDCLWCFTQRASLRVVSKFLVDEMNMILDNESVTLAESLECFPVLLNLAGLEICAKNKTGSMRAMCYIRQIIYYDRACMYFPFRFWFLLRDMYTGYYFFYDMDFHFIQDIYMRMEASGKYFMIRFAQVPENVPDWYSGTNLVVSVSGKTNGTICMIQSLHGSFRVVPVLV